MPRRSLDVPYAYNKGNQAAIIFRRDRHSGSFVFTEIEGLTCKRGNCMGKFLPFPIIGMEFGRGKHGAA